MTEISHADPAGGAGAQAPDHDLAETPRFVPGQPDMWAFVLFEALVFTGYFAVYLFYRSDHPDLILRSQAQLDVRLGILNTLLMLTSSWAMARCVKASRAGDFAAASTNASLTALFGVAFLAAKVLEWTRLAHAGFGFSSNEFFTYYFLLTGIHCLHLLIGFVAIGVSVYQLRRRAGRSQELVETSAVYWHTVDLLWVLIFSLLYVVR